MHKRSFTYLLSLWIISLFCTAATHSAAAQPFVFDELDVYNSDAYKDPIDRDSLYDTWDYKPKSPDNVDTTTKPIRVVTKKNIDTSNAPVFNELDVYEEDIYQQETAPTDNDEYYYYEPGKSYAPIRPGSPEFDELGVYETEPYVAPNNVTLGNNNSANYFRDNDIYYAPVENNIPYDQDQLQNYYLPPSYDNSVPNVNNYKPSREFYPDYYDF